MTDQTGISKSMKDLGLALCEVASDVRAAIEHQIFVLRLLKKIADPDTAARKAIEG